MIHLDTNCMIGLVENQTLLQPRAHAWFRAGEKFAMSAIAWSEFLNGPATSQQIADATGMLETRIIPFGRLEAELAARLFNRTGRKRGSQPDCFIAATAICARVPLATLNQKDFLPFVAAGLSLA